MDYKNKLAQIPQETRDKWASIQDQLRQKIIYQDGFDAKNLKYLAGVDITFDKFNQEVACAGIVVLDFKTLQNVLCLYGYFQIDVPYVPGFLAFRECDPIVEIYNYLIQNYPQFKPEVILVDGNGILHPHQCGFASHLGAVLDVPTIGVSKTMFFIDGIGVDYFDEVKEQIQLHNSKPLIGKSGKVWGAAFKSSNQEAVIVNVGHKVCLDTAVDIVRQCCLYKVVEPVRQADKFTRQLIMRKKKVFGQIFKEDFQEKNYKK
ncbi:hypothetical protein pb186bvf_020281 [Paramecium bursaria]